MSSLLQDFRGFIRLSFILVQYYEVLIKLLSKGKIVLNS